MAKAKSRAPKRAVAAKAKRATRRRATPARAAKKAVPARKAAKPKKKAAKRSAARPKPVKRTAPAPTPIARRARKAAVRKLVPAPKPKLNAAKSAKAAPPPAASRAGRAPTLDRERRRATDPDLVPTPPSSLDLDRSASAVRSGRADLAHKIHEHTSTGPALTAGDVDADWESADSIGDEAPGGDNPTPDQDVVDEIGRSLGVEYDDDEELQGGDEIGARDRKRWELDPASADDFDEREK